LAGCFRHPCARCAREGQFGTRWRILWRREAYFAESHVAQFFFPLARNSRAFDPHPFDWEQAELLWPPHSSVEHDTQGYARTQFQSNLINAHD